ncbi:MAG: DUF2612 domain-containing protein [Pseudomonadota bacterium]
MQNVEQTIISQYANSPTLTNLVHLMDQYIDPTANIDAFYNLVFNVMSEGATLSDYGLDIWGRIVGVSRNLSLPEDIDNPGGYVFSAGTYRLDNEFFRTLILVKALANITDCTASSINRLLSNLFTGRGRCYVLDKGDMTMEYVFEFYLQPFEYAIVTTSGAIPHPTGVQSTVLQVDVENTFGFNEAVNLQPFDQGAFYPG